MLDAERAFYELHNGAAHRGAHLLSEEGTEIYEDARATVAGFLGADPGEIVFTKSATEAINLVAYTLTSSVGPGDEILITEMEHHANLVPWQLLGQRTGATLRWFTVAPDGQLDLDPALITGRTKIVAVTGQSNVTGVMPRWRDRRARARRRRAGAGRQRAAGAASAGRREGLDVDFLAFSGHKMLGPFGLGVLYGKPEGLAALPPFLGGGAMIEVVRMEGSTFRPPRPGSSRACRPRAGRGPGRRGRLPDRPRHGNVAAHEESLTAHALDALREINGVRILGPDTTKDRGSAVAFEVEGVHPHDVGQVLDELGIAVRTGHHCASAAPGTRRAGQHPRHLLRVQHAR